MYNYFNNPEYRQVNCPGGTVYVIKSGDTIYRLAVRYNLSVDAILRANPGLDPDALRVGQQICLPIAPTPTCPGGQIYVIKSGDTIYSIAQAFRVTLDALLAANPGINPDALVVGQRICIPGTQPACPGGQIYTIKQGDTIYQLAQRYQVSVDAIIGANPGLNPNAMYIGQKICIPGRPTLNCPSGNIYVIKPGDNLYTLSRRFNVPLQALLTANPQLKDPANLTVGTNICVPSPMMTEE